MLFECAKSIMVVVDDTWQYVHLTIILWRYDTDGWRSYAVVAFLSSIYTIVYGFNVRFTIITPESPYIQPNNQHRDS